MTQAPAPAASEAPAAPASAAPASGSAAPGSAVPAPGEAPPGDEVTVRVEDVHVSYRVYDDPETGLKQIVAGGRRRRFRTIRALQGVSFDLRRGETLGVIGPNGSGKSTLLAAMTGLLPLESGWIRGSSRPALLGVSAALRPSLSGRRNIMIGGLALGMTREEVRERLDEIADFAGLGDFLDLPMRTYSSGMRARLLFAIATVRIPEVLLIDEALAVGDQQFRIRSRRRIDEIRAAAGSVVLVTHDLAEVTDGCDRAIWLDAGVVRGQGDPAEVVAAYESSVGAA